MQVSFKCYLKYKHVCALQNASKFSEVGGDIQMYPLQCINKFK